MSFRALTFFVTCQSWQEADKIDKAVAKIWPFSRHMILQQAFTGVGAMVDPDVLSRMFRERGSSVYSESNLTQNAFEIFEKGLPDLSTKFQGKAFVYIKVDCLVHPCLFSGAIFRSGRKIYEQKESETGDVQLLVQAGMYSQNRI